MVMQVIFLLYLYLKDQFANVCTYIPKREGEGYGLNCEALQSLYDLGITLIVTVDCGISGVKEVAEAVLLEKLPAPLSSVQLINS